MTGVDALREVSDEFSAVESVGTLGRESVQSMAAEIVTYLYRKQF